MKINDIQNRIHTDEAFVQTEIEKIFVYLNLMHTLRYNHSRDGKEMTQSVAEHVYGMHILCDYFLPLHTETLDHTKVRMLISWHDMAEALVGDMTAETKTTAHKEAEFAAEQELTKNAPSQIKDEVTAVFGEYHALATKEAQFVRALDKLEPLFYLVLLSRKQFFKAFEIEWSVTDDKAYRGKSIQKFPLLQRFDDVLSLELDTLAYYPENR